MISTLKDYATRITINFQNKKGQIVLDQFSKALENGKYPEYVEKVWNRLTDSKKLILN